MQRRKFLEMLGLGTVGLVLASKIKAKPEELNPPDLDSWKVARGFPRKHNDWEEEIALKLVAGVRKRANELCAEMILKS